MLKIMKFVILIIFYMRKFNDKIVLTNKFIEYLNYNI